MHGSVSADSWVCAETHRRFCESACIRFGGEDIRASPGGAGPRCQWSNCAPANGDAPAEPAIPERSQDVDTARNTIDPSIAYPALSRRLCEQGNVNAQCPRRKRLITSQGRRRDQSGYQHIGEQHSKSMREAYFFPARSSSGQKKAVSMGMACAALVENARRRHAWHEGQQRSTSRRISRAAFSALSSTVPDHCREAVCAIQMRVGMKPVREFCEATPAVP